MDAIIPMSQVLKPAINQNWAVGAYDVVNLSMIEGALEASKVDRAPVILLIYPNSVPVSHYGAMANFVKSEAARLGIETALVLDHGSTVEQVEAAIQSGFSGVMIDGSTLSFDQNIALTAQIVNLAHQKNVSVEAELGHVGEGDDGLSRESRRSHFTNPKDVDEFVHRTNVDALAISVGTAHGIYHFAPELDINLIHEIRALTDVALVLHGSSGTPAFQLEAAISAGIDKINVYTDIRLNVMQRIHNLFASQSFQSLDIIDIDKLTKEVTKDTIREKNSLFGSIGKIRSCF